MYIGIDIGGYNINSVLVKNNKVIKRHEILTKSKTSQKIIIKQIFDCIEFLLREVGLPSRSPTSRIKGIGIGVPGPVNIRGQKFFLNPPNMTGLKNVQLDKIIAKKFGIKTKTDNDTNCFGLAEAKLGAGRDSRIFVGLTLGTGLGGVIIIEGKIFRGASGSAGEFGPMMVGQNNLEFYRRNNKYLGIGLANIVNILNPDVIVIGGGLVNNKEFKLDLIKKTMKKYILSVPAKNTKVVKSKLGDDAGPLGATLLFK